MNLTIDASVFVSALRASESHHSDNRSFFELVGVIQPPTMCPALVVTETVAAIARTSGDLELVAAAQELITSVPGIVLVDITLPCCVRAASLAASHKLRGADSFYVLISVEASTTLITLDHETLDHEMLARASAVVPAMTPFDWLTLHSTEELPE